MELYEWKETSNESHTCAHDRSVDHSCQDNQTSYFPQKLEHTTYYGWFEVAQCRIQI